MVVYATGTLAHLAGAGLGLDAVVAVVWVVGITNTFNLLDNIGGLSADVAAIASFWLFVVGLVNGEYFVAILSLALVGCAAGFLRHNRFPARIYMGDTAASISASSCRSWPSTSVRTSACGRPSSCRSWSRPCPSSTPLWWSSPVWSNAEAPSTADRTTRANTGVHRPACPRRRGPHLRPHYGDGLAGDDHVPCLARTSILLAGWVVAVGVFLGVLLGTVPRLRDEQAAPLHAPGGQGP